MFWPDRGSGVSVEPARTPVASAVRQYFTEGGAGQPPTVPGGDWFNQITNEILNVLEAAGIVPDKNDDTQLLAAINTVSDTAAAREALRRSYADAGFNLVSGSFETGGELNNPNDVLLQRSTGLAFSWGSSFPKNVPAGSTPESSGGISPGAWTDQSPSIVANQVAKVFDNTVALASAKLTVGLIYRTKGFYAAGDGGGAYYIGRGTGTPFDGYSSIESSNGVVAVLLPLNSLVVDVQCGVKKVFTQAELDTMPDQTPQMQAFIDYVRTKRIRGQMAGGASSFDGTLYYDPDAFQQGANITGAGNDPLVTTVDLSNGTIFYQRTAGDTLRLNCIKGTTNKRQANGLQHFNMDYFTIMGPPEATEGAGNGCRGIFGRTIRACNFSHITFFQLDRMVDAKEVGDYCDYNRFVRIRHRDIYRSGIRIRQNDDGLIDMLTNNCNHWNPQDTEDGMIIFYGGYRPHAMFVCGNPPTAATSFIYSRYCQFRESRSPFAEFHNEFEGWKVMGLIFSNCTSARFSGYSRDSTIGVINTPNIQATNWTSALFTQDQKHFFFFGATDGASPNIVPVVMIDDNCRCISFAGNTHDSNQVELGFTAAFQSGALGRLRRGTVSEENGYLRKRSPDNVFAQFKNEATYVSSVPTGNTVVGTISIPNVTSGGVIEVDVLVWGPGVNATKLSKITLGYTRAANASAVFSSAVVDSGTVGSPTVTLSVSRVAAVPAGTEVFQLIAANSAGATYQAAVASRSGITIGSSPASIP